MEVSNLSIFCGICILCLSAFVNAIPITNTQTLHTQQSSSDAQSATTKRSAVMPSNVYIAFPISQQKRIAGIFNLKPEEYTSYLHYMNDTMDGYEYSQNINPNLIMAMHTKDPDLYKHYLSNVARADHDAVTRMLRVSIDYSRVMKELYPNEMPIMTPAMRARAANKLGDGDVVQLFCNPHGAVCGNILGVIKEPILKSGGARLDLFLVGNIKRSNIVAFAKNNNISPDDVRARRITLNFGNTPFKALESESHHKLPLPYLIVRRDGKSIPVDLGGSHA